MTKLGYPQLPVIVRAEPGPGAGMSESTKPCLVITILGLLIALCLASPFCVIGLGTLISGGPGTKHLSCSNLSPLQESFPVTLQNSRPVAGGIDDRQTNPKPVSSSTPGPGEELANSLVRSGIAPEGTDIAAQAEDELPHSKTINELPGSGKAHRRRGEGTPAGRRSEEKLRSKTANHRGKANSTANRTRHGEKHRAALSRPGSRENRKDQADCLSSLVSAE
jgi:hypothetical protein